MPKYKITKPFLKEFFGLFGKPKESRSEKLNKIINNDPILKKLDKDMGDINAKAYERIKDDETLHRAFAQYGIKL